MVIVIVLAYTMVLPAASIYAWQNREAKSGLEGPEFGRNTAIDYILLHHNELGELEIPSYWQMKNVTPEGLVGLNEIHFKGGRWFVRVSNAVVYKPIYTVSLEYNSDVCFHWEGTVDQDGNVVELEFARAYPAN
jgi:hypothetical protein